MVGKRQWAKEIMVVASDIQEIPFWLLKLFFSLFIFISVAGRSFNLRAPTMQSKRDFNYCSRRSDLIMNRKKKGGRRKCLLFRYSFLPFFLFVSLRKKNYFLVEHPRQNHFAAFVISIVKITFFFPPFALFSVYYYFNTKFYFYFSSFFFFFQLQFLLLFSIFRFCLWRYRCE